VLAMLSSITPWILRRSGTCSAVHFKRLELERIGSLMIDRDKLIRAFRTMKPGTSSAIDGISITNSLGLLREVPPVLPPLGKPARSIHGTPISLFGFSLKTLPPGARRVDYQINMARVEVRLLSRLKD